METCVRVFLFALENVILFVIDFYMRGIIGMEEQKQIQLPQAFVERMKESLDEEAEAFLASYDSVRAYGLRRNPLKMEREQFEAQMPLTLKKVSWAKEGYYYQETERPGKHPDRKSVV